MPKVSAEHMQARREQIASAAVREFSRGGIHSTSMANIIEASGLSAGAIYGHFSGKDEIIAYVARTEMQRAFDSVHEFLAGDSLPDPEAVLARVKERIDAAGVSTGFIVQCWGEATTNPAIRSIANEHYTAALGFLRTYLASWVATTEGLSARRARREAEPQAHRMLGLIYAHIVKAALIDGRADASPVGPPSV